MNSISDMTNEEQYEAFRHFSIARERKKIQSSLSKIRNLHDDIDAPIRKCVAMLALLECEPVFSCCGFDYDGQPYHKCHQYGDAYITMKNNSQTDAFFPNGARWGDWSIAKTPERTMLRLFINANPHWRDETCIHFSEEIVIGISRLEYRLMQSYQITRDEIVLTDSLAEYPKWWQYPRVEDWLVEKRLLNTY